MQQLNAVVILRDMCIRVIARILAFIVPGCVLGFSCPGGEQSFNEFRLKTGAIFVCYYSGAPEAPAKRSDLKDFTVTSDGTTVFGIPKGSKDPMPIDLPPGIVDYPIYQFSLEENGEAVVFTESTDIFAKAVPVTSTKITCGRSSCTAQKKQRCAFRRPAEKSSSALNSALARIRNVQANRWINEGDIQILCDYALAGNADALRFFDSGSKEAKLIDGRIDGHIAETFDSTARLIEGLKSLNCFGIR